MKNFPNEAPTPAEPSFAEVIRYYVNETERRAAESVAGLTDAELNHDPGQGAWTIGMLLKHQTDLLRMIAETILPGATKDLPKPAIGQEGDWNLEALTAYRHALARRMIEVFNETPPEDFMKTQPGAYPPRWAEWPILLRILRPIVDMATHVGQVNYARRQLGLPVGTRKS